MQQEWDLERVLERAACRLAWLVQLPVRLWDWFGVQILEHQLEAQRLSARSPAQELREQVELELRRGLGQQLRSLLVRARLRRELTAQELGRRLLQVAALESDPGPAAGLQLEQLRSEWVRKEQLAVLTPVRPRREPQVLWRRGQHQPQDAHPELLPGEVHLSVMRQLGQIERERLEREHPGVPLQEPKIQWPATQSPDQRWAEEQERLELQGPDVGELPAGAREP